MCGCWFTEDSADRGVFSLGSSLREDFSAGWIRAHTRDAHEILGKPFVLEEFGVTGADSGAVIDQRVGGGAEEGLLSPYISARAERARRADVVAQYYRGVSECFFVFILVLFLFWYLCSRGRRRGCEGGGLERACWCSLHTASAKISSHFSTREVSIHPRGCGNNTRVFCVLFPPPLSDSLPKTELTLPYYIPPPPPPVEKTNQN